MELHNVVKIYVFFRTSSFIEFKPTIPPRCCRQYYCAWQEVL